MATKDIRIFTRPTGNPTIQLSGSAYSSIALEVLESGSVSFQGTSGSLFSISDSLSGSLMSVNDISGLPILEVFDDDRVVMGQYGQDTLVITGSKVGFGTNAPGSGISNHFQSPAGTLAKFETTSTNSSPDILIVDGDNNSARASLQIQGNAGAIESLFVASNGAVGIGTVNPGATIDVRGTYSHFGSSGGDMYMKNNELNFGNSSAAEYTGYVN